MSQLRQNPITKQWVIISPNRAKRPEEYKTQSVMRGLPEFDPKCVFCPGNEKLNPDLCENVCRLPNNDDWQIRVIPNKFQALEQTKLYKHKEFYNSQAGYGDHEVVINRKHNEPVALQSATLLEQTLGVFQDRIKELSKDEKMAYVQIFHNHGKESGASLVHPHYQIMSLPLIPPQVHNEMLGCRNYRQVHGTCIYCDIIKEELKVQDRIVFEDEHFVVMSAYASRSPFETWIVPKRHSGRFENITKKEVKHLAYLLKTVLGALHTKLSDPPLNFYIHTMPFVRSNHIYKEENDYHWHLTVFPRLSTWAGLEYATGIPINIMPPEVTAKFLRE